MSDSLWFHGLQPARRLYPRDSPGERTGVESPPGDLPSPGTESESPGSPDPDLGMELKSPSSSELQVDSLWASHQGSPPEHYGGSSRH